MKRVLFFVLSLIMAVSSIGVISFAEEAEEYYIDVEFKRDSGISLSYNITIHTNCPEFYVEIYYPDGTKRGSTMKYPGNAYENGAYVDDSNYHDYDGEYTFVFYYEDCRTEVVYTVENSYQYKAWWVRTYGYTPEDKNSTEATEDESSKNSGGDKVTSIVIDETLLGCYPDETIEVGVKSGKALSVEVENEDIVEATLSNGVLKITGLKVGESAIWLRNSDTYTTVDVIVCYDVAKNASEWAKADVRKALDDGFVPSELREEWTRSITREEFAKMAVRFLDLEGVSSVVIEPEPFDDTENPYVLAAYEAGIVKGAGERKFNPTGNITRQEAAVMLMRVAKYMGAEIDMPSPEFNDNDTIAPWAVDAVGWVQETGIMQGDENGNFNPSEEHTVEQSIVTFVRLGEIMTRKNI